MKLNSLVNKKKGQAAITDLFVAIGIFIVLIAVTSVLWNLYSLRLQNRIIYDDLVVKGFQISDLLLKTSGDPPNWDILLLNGELLSPVDENINYVGLVKDELNIANNKTLALTLLGEANMQKIFHAEQYSIGIRIRDASGEDVYLFGKIGGSAKYSVNLGRNIMYQDAPRGTFNPSTIEVILSK